MAESGPVVVYLCDLKMLWDIHKAVYSLPSLDMERLSSKLFSQPAKMASKYITETSKVQ